MTDNKPMPELLPCPFCGAQPEFFVGCDDDFDFASYQCTNPKCWFTQCYDEKHIASAAWNTRADLCANDGDGHDTALCDESMSSVRVLFRELGCDKPFIDDCCTAVLEKFKATPTEANQFTISVLESRLRDHTELLREALDGLELMEDLIEDGEPEDRGHIHDLIIKLTAALKPREDKP